MSWYLFVVGRSDFCFEGLLRFVFGGIQSFATVA